MYSCQDIPGFEQETAILLKILDPPKKTKKTISRGRHLISKIKNKFDIEIRDREKIAEIATEFYKDIYDDRREINSIS